MVDTLQGGQLTSASRREQVIRATQVAHEAEVHQSANGVRFATFGETGVPAPDLDRMLEAVPAPIVSALGANTYYFVPLALREPSDSNEATESEPSAKKSTPDQAMVARAWSDDLGESAICHRNIELGSGHRGVFISTRLMSDRFALSFEFFINVAHAFVDATGVPERFADLVWQQALDGIRGETSLDAWESRHLTFGQDPNAPNAASASPEAMPATRRTSFAAKARPFSSSPQPAQPPMLAAAAPAVIDEKERGLYLESAFSDAVAIYLLSLALDLDYSELREREYPLLAPHALAARLRLVAELFPPNPGYDFSVRYRRRA
ncbi:MAG TPA: hypothetical protein VHY48_06305 [Acidobacteriaceae bacterium]|jgi:hypothetical protein|nr:hypothetical protein [Acidobacteriaceae bacterium]